MYIQNPDSNTGTKSILGGGIFFALPFQKGRSKKMPPQKTQEKPGFFACQGAQKVQGSSVDAKAHFRKRQMSVEKEPALGRLRV